MKTICLITLGLCLHQICYSQTANDSILQLGYVYDHFVPGRVLLKNGTLETAELNYDANNQGIAFISQGQFMTLTNINDIDTVYIESAKFVPIKGVFFEIINASASSETLFASYSCKSKPVTASVDHNGTSNQNKSQVSGNISDMYVNKRYKGNFLMEFQKEYLLQIKSTIYKANNEKQIRKIFPEKSDAIHAFIEENKIDFKKQEDVIKLIKFCNNEL